MRETMKRSRFLAGMFAFVGVARAQQWKDCVRDKENQFLCTDKMKPALNNQCPVCGTMAEKYVRPLEDANGGMMANCTPNPNTDPNDPSTWWVTCDPPKMVPVGPVERITRCKRCNAAFWQDTEEPKAK